MQRSLILPSTIVDTNCVALFRRDGEEWERGPAPMDPAHGLERIIQVQHGEKVEGSDVEDLDGVIRTSRREAPPICADADRPDVPIVGLELLDELDASEILLPELYDAVDGGGDEEFGKGGEGGEGELVPVHQGAEVATGGGQGGDVEFLIGQFSLLPLWGRGGEGGAEIIFGGGIICVYVSGMGLLKRWEGLPLSTAGFGGESCSISDRDLFAALGERGPSEAMAVKLGANDARGR